MCTTLGITLIDMYDIICENIRTAREAWAQQDHVTSSYGKKGD
jgi:hypothetical protein